jgi:anaerobic sulfite reductase subunit A
MNNSLEVSGPEVARKRAKLYGFFSQFYLEYLTPEFVDMIKNGDVIDALDVLEDTEGHKLFRRFMSAAKGTESLQNELETEFTGLFCISSGAGSHESIYLDEKQRIGGKCTMKVKQFYDKYDAEISIDSIVVADHIGMELSFLEFLCNREAEAWESSNNEIAANCLNAQKEFLDKHICNWIDNFVSEVKEKAGYDFYKAIAVMTRDWLRDEKGWLDNVSMEGES